MEAGARISIEAEVSPVQQIGTVPRAAAAALVLLLRLARGDRISISEDCKNAESALATQQITRTKGRLKQRAELFQYPLGPPAVWSLALRLLRLLPSHACKRLW